MFLDMRCGADLVRPHDLPIIDKEHRHLRCVKNLADLRLVRAMLSFRKPISASLANAVGFVADQYVYLVVLGAAIAVEVLERCSRASADDFPQRLGEGLGARGVVSVTSF